MGYVASMSQPESSRQRNLLAQITVWGSGVLIFALVAAYYVFSSQLALAQAADSFLDVFTALVLAWSVRVAAQPEDEKHPFGHARAEPLAALLAAMVTGILAFQVLQSAISALVSNTEPRLDYVLAVVFAVKLVFKFGVTIAARRLHGQGRSPAMQALAVDARNDVLINALSIVGFFVARFGWPAVDAFLAMPIALWIAYSGIELALDNIRLLMGEAPEMQRQNELLAIAGEVPGVLDTHDLRAHYIGTVLQLHLHVAVAPDLSVQAGHDIGEAVRERLESEHDVGVCSVHIDAHA